MTTLENPSSHAKSSGPAQHSIYKNIRVRKENSAYVYFILESHEGIASYSTLAHVPSDLHRDLELRIPPDFLHEVNDLLVSLGDMIYELPENSK